MNIIGPLNPTAVIQWPVWVWQNRDRIASFPGEAADFVQTFVESSGESVQRIGSSLVYGTPDGAKRVLAFVEENGDLPGRLDALSSGQAALSSTLGGLQSMCLVTLGLSVVTPGILLTQFAFLSRQFNSLKKQLRELQEQWDSSQTAELKNGLDSLDVGVAKQNRSLVDQSHDSLNKSVHYFRQRLERVLDDKPNKPDRALVLYLMRHLSVAICGTARCRIAQEYDDLALSMLDEHKVVLQGAASRVFSQTAGHDPDRFLIPELKDVDLEFLRSLYQQAHWAGIDAGDVEIREASRSAAKFFDGLRPRIFRRLRSPFKPKPEPLRSELRDATAGIEEANRVLSLRSFLEEAKQAGQRAIDVIHTLRDELKGSDARFVAWSMGTPQAAKVQNDS